MAADELDAEEQKLLEKHRAAKRKEREAQESGLRAWLRNANGEEAEVPYAKARTWLGKTFGIDLDEEPVQDEPGDDDKDEPKGRNSTAKRAFGRTIGAA